MSEKLNCQGGRTNRGARGQMIWLAAALVVGAWATNTYGQTAVTWDGTTGAYTTATNWNPDVTPSNIANEFLTINNGGTAQVVTGDAAEGAHLYLGLQPGDTGHLTINGGTITLGEMRVGGLEQIPDLVTPANPATPNGGGTGSVVQNGGTVNLTYSTGVEPPRQSLWVGDAGLAAANTANGSYTITGTEAAPAVLLNGIAANDGIFVGTGVGTVGAFTQNAFTTVTSTGFVNVGRRGASATYTMNNGVLNAQGNSGGLSLFVGDGDTTGIQTTSGTFTQNAGTFTIAQGASIGRRGGDGFYNMAGGILNQTSGTVIIGDGVGATTAPGTNGTFTQTGGDVNPVNLTVAQLSGTGVYSISAGTLDVTTAMAVGSVGSVATGLISANGTLNVSGTGAITVGGNLNLSFGSATTPTNGVGTIHMTGGSMQLNAAGAIFAIGNGRVSSATVNLSGGTINVLGATSLINIGRNNGPGVMNISGTGVLNANNITVDSTDVATTRTLSISGGTVDLNILTLGSVASQSTRLVDISGGTVNIGTLSTGQATGAGQALTHIHGGTVTLENVLTFFTGSVFRLSAINLAVPANSTYGNANIDVLSGSTLTLNGTFGTGTAVRTLTKTGPGTLTINGTQSYAATAGVNINGGTINYNTDAGAGGRNLAVNANGGIASFGADQSLRQLDVAGGGVVNVNTSNDNVNTNALSLDGSPQTFGLTYGSLASSAVIKSNVYFAGTGIVTVGTAGDYNISGEVEAGDYVIWRNNQAGFGGSAGYDLWRMNFGNVVVPGSGLGSGNQAVPEPGTLLLVLAGVLLACFGWRRR